MKIRFRGLLVIVLWGTLLLSMHYANAQGSTIADNIRVVTPPGTERCSVVQPYRNPQLQNPLTGRLLSQPLRDAARLANPLNSLSKATVAFAQNNVLMGNAYSDLAVTGQRTFASFRNLHRQQRITETNIVQSLASNRQARAFQTNQLRSAATRAINRAYRVAQVIRATNRPEAERSSLGYITVSAEDDHPHRPVNVSTSKYPQYNQVIPVRTRIGGRVININTRFIIAENRPIPAARRLGSRQLPNELPPRLSNDAKVLIYVHGMDSRLEEAEKMAKALHDQFPHENWTVISMDLPSSGYATMLDHLQVSRLDVLGRVKNISGFDARGQHNAPVLDFIEDFVISFVDTLEPNLQLKDKVQAVIGGSLGGNITFRLGRRQPNVPWIPNVVTWSPGSIWTSLTGDVFKEKGIKTGFKRAGGELEEVPETLDKRQIFFSRAWYDKDAFFLERQPDMWWGNSYSCKTNSKNAALFDRFEIYNKNFRLWHWRLGTEQLIYTHREPVNSRTPRFMANRANMLLAAGEEDDYKFTNIYSATRSAAEQMTKTPGEALFLRRTGHSIHDERPNYFSREIIGFLNAANREESTFDRVILHLTTTVDDIRNGSRAWITIKLFDNTQIEREITHLGVGVGRNASRQLTIPIGRQIAPAYVRSMTIRHHSGDCFACGRDYWNLRAELQGNGIPLISTGGNIRIGHQSLTFQNTRQPPVIILPWYENIFIF